MLDWLIDAALLMLLVIAACAIVVGTVWICVAVLLPAL